MEELAKCRQHFDNIWQLNANDWLRGLTKAADFGESNRYNMVTMADLAKFRHRFRQHSTILCKWASLTKAAELAKATDLAKLYRNDRFTDRQRLGGKRKWQALRDPWKEASLANTWNNSKQMQTRRQERPVGTQCSLLNSGNKEKFWDALNLKFI